MSEERGARVELAKIKIIRDEYDIFLGGIVLRGFALNGYATALEFFSSRQFEKSNDSSKNV